MSVIRVEKTKNYTVMSNYHLQDKQLSLKAKGLLSFMLSLPEDWDYSVEGLIKCSTDGRTAVRAALQELEEHNYLTRRRIYTNGKVTDVEYTVFEVPHPVQNLTLENVTLGNVTLENQRQINTKITKYEYNKDTKKKGISKDIPGNQEFANTSFKNSSSKKDRKFKILKMIETKLLEYDIQDEQVYDKVMEFYSSIIDNKLGAVTEQRVSADLMKLAKVNTATQLRTIQLSLDKGYKTFDPEWLNKNRGTTKQSFMTNNTQERYDTLEEQDKVLQQKVRMSKSI